MNSIKDRKCSLVYAVNENNCPVITGNEKQKHLTVIKFKN